MKKAIGIVGLVLLTGFLLIQLIPYGHQHTNPPVQQEPAWPDTQTRDLAVRACFDCHSNETTWPWYSNIAPVSWLVAHDVEEGRQRMNFSEWNRAHNAVGEVSEVVNSGEMPPFYYAIMHPKAQLTDAEKQILVNGITSSAQP
jgi:hypothetical protein